MAGKNFIAYLPDDKPSKCGYCKVGYCFSLICFTLSFSHSWSFFSLSLFLSLFVFLSLSKDHMIKQYGHINNDQRLWVREWGHILCHVQLYMFNSTRIWLYGLKTEFKSYSLSLGIRPNDRMTIWTYARCLGQDVPEFWNVGILYDRAKVPGHDWPRLETIWQVRIYVTKFFRLSVCLLVSHRSLFVFNLWKFRKQKKRRKLILWPSILYIFPRT